MKLFIVCKNQHGRIDIRRWFYFYLRFELLIIINKWNQFEQVNIHEMQTHLKWKKLNSQVVCIRISSKFPNIHLIYVTFTHFVSFIASSRTSFCIFHEIEVFVRRGFIFILRRWLSNGIIKKSDFFVQHEILKKLSKDRKYNIYAHIHRFRFSIKFFPIFWDIKRSAIDVIVIDFCFAWNYRKVKWIVIPSLIHLHRFVFIAQIKRNNKWNFNLQCFLVLISVCFVSIASL